MKIYESAEELIGGTPLFRMRKIEAELGLDGHIIAKLERTNLTSSAKDRAALFIIKQKEKEGILKEGSVIIEPTSGNTGIALAAICATRGYRAIIVMPDTASVERRRLISAYGAEVVLTEGSLGMSGAIAKAEELKELYEGAIIAGQFENPQNPEAHYATTGPEIYADTDGEVAYFVASVGTGGTLSGAGRFLKEKIEGIKVIAVEPDESAVLSGESASPHKIQGIGAGFIPKTTDESVIDRIERVSYEDAVRFMLMASRTEGVLIGISSGAALAAAARIAALPEAKDKNIAVILPDSGERYLSVGIFD
jgi:cysteine synthase A